MKQAFPIKEALVYGWRSFKERPCFFLCVTGFFLVLSIVVELFSKALHQFGGENVVSFAWFVVQWWFLAGSFVIGLSWYRTKTVSFEQLFSVRGKKLVYFFATLALQYLISLFGILLLIIPGIIWSIKFSFAPYFVLDKDMKPLDALKASSKLTKGYGWALLGLYLTIAVLNVLGVFALLVGVLVTSSVGFLAFVFAYEWLMKHTTKEDTPLHAPTTATQEKATA